MQKSPTAALCFLAEAHCGPEQAWVRRARTAEQRTGHPEAQRDSSQRQLQKWGIKPSDQAFLFCQATQGQESLSVH